MNTLLTFGLKFIDTNTFKKIVKFGLTKIVESTDNSIDNELVDFMFNTIITSNGNEIKEIVTK